MMTESYFLFLSTKYSHTKLQVFNPLFGNAEKRSVVIVKMCYPQSFTTQRWWPQSHSRLYLKCPEICTGFSVLWSLYSAESQLKLSVTTGSGASFKTCRYSKISAEHGKIGLRLVFWESWWCFVYLPAYNSVIAGWVPWNTSCVQFSVRWEKACNPLLYDAKPLNWAVRLVLIQM